MDVGLKWHGQQQAVHSGESRIEVSKKKWRTTDNDFFRSG